MMPKSDHSNDDDDDNEVEDKLSFKQAPKSAHNLVEVDLEGNKIVPQEVGDIKQQRAGLWKSLFGYFKSKPKDSIIPQLEVEEVKEQQECQLV